MYSNPVVSVVIIFLNAAEFLQQATESVLAQTFEQWELFLVDDGSTDTSTQIAREYADRHPGKVFYLDHLKHTNLGKGASRNLGIRRARGEYIAFLDADDIWLPHKLEQQIAIINSYPEVGMLYGDTLYWYSWTGDAHDIPKDFIPKLGVETNTLINPPKLIPLYLRGKAAVPCTCSVLVKRKVAEVVEGFDENCEGISKFYEDQAFFAKICLAFPVMAVNICWDKYRQHSHTRKADNSLIIEEHQARKHFLKWLDGYMILYGIEDIEVLQAIRKELWLIKSFAWIPDASKVHTRIRWVKKWLLRVEERFLPPMLQNWLWIRK